MRDSMRLNDAIRRWCEIDAGKPLSDDAAVRGQLTDAIFQKRITTDHIKELLAIADQTAGATNMTTSTPAPETVFGGGNGNESTKASRVVVKGEYAKYRTDRYVAKHAKTGEPVMYGGAPVERPSELQFAKAGVVLKWRALQSGMQGVPPLTEHEQGMLKQMVAEDAWCGQFANRWVEGVKLADLHMTKDPALLLNDGTSGGQYLVPADFDAAIVTFPLLTGELLPYVDLQNMSRDTIEGASIGTPSVSWGQADGSAVTLFDATALVSQLSTDSENVMIAVEVGRDLLSDSPADIGRILVDVIGQRMAAELDRVIADGNGTTEPQGILRTSSATTVNSIQGSGGPLMLGDLERLMFALEKQYRVASFGPCFIGNDVMYRHARGIPVGQSDARRVLGDAYGSYNVMGHPYRVANGISNGKLAFAALKRYRLYRRQGFETRWTDQGKSLALTNTALLTVRGRWGGRCIDPAAVTIMSDAQAVAD